MYNKLEHKQAFCRALAFRLGIEKETVRNYLETDRVPEKHKNRVETALKIQLNLDEKNREIQLKAFENV